MLRLLPERLFAGLVGPHAWLAVGATSELLPMPVTSETSPVRLLEALLQAAPRRARASKLSVMLPSSYARCVSLPWSPDIRGVEEKQAYALAHLERAGLSVDDTHVVHAEFRHFGAQGLAYAVPRQLLDELHVVAARFSLDLTTALPISGIAHLAARRARGTGLEIALLVEDNAASALLMDCTGLQRFDAEPVVGGQRQALRRLLTRVAIDSNGLEGIALCTDVDDEELARIAGTFTSQDSVQQMKSPQWRRFL